MQSITRNASKERRLFYCLEEHRDSRGICVFVHGLGDDKGSFAHLAQSAHDQRYDSLLYDLPGCGENRSIRVEEFEQNLDLLSDLVRLHANKQKEIVLVGHSMGGLIVLLSVLRHGLPARVLTIEASLTTRDHDFFRQIREPPRGIGYAGLLQRTKAKCRSDLYAARYYENLKRASPAVIQAMVDQIDARFLRYRDSVLNSGIPFFYVYGADSVGAEERQRLASHRNITVRCFNDARHWVHVDADDSFRPFFVREFLR